MSSLPKPSNAVRQFVYRSRNRQLPSISGGHSAFGQDLFVAELLGSKRGGVFVDIGANDGVSISNTLYFEKELGWSGIAVEPMPRIFAELDRNRSCHKVNGCIATKLGTARFVEIVGSSNMLSTLENNNKGLMARRIKKNLARTNSTVRTIEVDCYTFADVLKKFGVSHVDFLSLDTEGGELAILKNIDFDITPVSVISVENNYSTNCVQRYLKSQGFLFLGAFKHDEIYMFGGAGLRNVVARRAA